MFSFKFAAMGTELEISIFDNVSPILEEKIKQEIFDYTMYYDQQLSRFKNGSIVNRIEKQEGVYTVPRELVELLEIYERFYIITDGKMSPLIGQTISDLGYDATYSLKKKGEIRKTPKLEDTLEILTQDKIKVNKKVLIDVGAIGKGFWVDKVRNILEKNKITNFLINGSGDINYSTTFKKEAEIGLENSEGNIFGSVKIENESICGSGTQKRKWSVAANENLHHVVDATTGIPTNNILSVWIKMPNSPLSTALCDALSTAIFFVEPNVLQEKFEKHFGYNFEYYIIYNNKKTLASENFSIETVND